MVGRTDSGFINNDSKLINTIQISSFSADMMSKHRKIYTLIIGFSDIIHIVYKKKNYFRISKIPLNRSSVV